MKTQNPNGTLRRELGGGKTILVLDKNKIRKYSRNSSNDLQNKGEKTFPSNQIALDVFEGRLQF
jgi:hypothetical protein